MTPLAGIRWPHCSTRNSVSADIADSVKLYQTSLKDKTLPDIPLHLKPLIRGKIDYEQYQIETRRRMLAAFQVFTQHTPFQYREFAYEKAHFASNVEKLSKRMERDLTAWLRGNLGFFQSFDSVKVYYDNGQPIVTDALHASVEKALSKTTIRYRNATPRDYRLSQVADYACGIELTALKYEAKRETETDRRFFGTWRDFENNYLKKLRKHRP